METDLRTVLSKIFATQLALESLRGKDTARALELLELELDASVIRLAIFAKEAEPAELDQVTDTLRQISAYRHAHPRRTEADLGDLASGLVVRSASLAKARAIQILEEIDKDAA